MSRINTLEHVFADPQTRANGMVAEATRGDASMPLVGMPFKLGEEAQPAPTAPPRCGEHTDAVLREWIGMGTEEVAALRAVGAI